jgi:hypothetical protein
MAALLVPINVAAKVIAAPTPVPSLAGDPFNTALSLAPGIHVHWALPDALTRAKTVGSNAQAAPTQHIFPGAPDLWLVTRFNPLAAKAATRTWTAWVVDSRAKTVTPLAQWSPPAPPPPPTATSPSMVHTLPKPLAAAADHPGWGLWDGTDDHFDNVITAAVYYPTGGNRFGFHDDLSDLLPKRTGGSPGGVTLDSVTPRSVSYTVIGWYSSSDYDPLAQAADRQAQIIAWGLAHDHPLLINILPFVAGAAPAGAPHAPTLPFNPQLTFTDHPQTRPASAQLKATTGPATARMARKQSIQTALGKAVDSSILATTVMDTHPDHMVCHGSIMDIPLDGPPPAAEVLSTQQIAVYPSAKRALATMTAGSGVSDQQLDYTEILLQDIDHQKGTMAGVIDMPGAAHALTFQSLPGKPACYGQIIISDHVLNLAAAGQVQFSLASATGATVTGHWHDDFRSKALSSTSSSASQAARISGIVQPLLGTAPPQPSPADITPAQLTAWFQTLKASAVIDPTMVRVTDTRARAKAPRLAPSIDGAGSSGAGYWIDITDPAAVTQLVTDTIGAVVTPQDKDHLYKQPGPRWYRPSSPQIVLTGAHRSYRFGEDGQFEPDGTLKCRLSGHTIYGIHADTGALVRGSAVLANAQALNVSGLPGETHALLNEAVLLDTGSAPALAAAAAPASATYLEAAIQGYYLQRIANLPQPATEALDKIAMEGTPPSPVAIMPWDTKNERYDPLYLDAGYSLQLTSLEQDWQLEEDHVEMTTKNPSLHPRATKSFTERTHVTASHTKILARALVTQTTVNPVGVTVFRQTPPNGLTDQTFQSMDTISAPLTALDAALLKDGERERDGILRIDKLSIVDVFGTTRPWNSEKAAGPSTTLPPRLPFWSRLSFRLQSAADQSREADTLHSAICGILLPDFLDHSLQVFDGSGQPLGEITTSPPRFGQGEQDPGGKLTVQFQPFPRVAATALNPLGGNQILQQLVDGITAQSVTIPAKNKAASGWFETGLTAMLRCIDTARATLDPSYNTPDRKLSLLGEPILVMVGRVKFETTSDTDRATIAQGLQTPLRPSPAVPSLSVRIGDIARPDDGVLGFFIPGDKPEGSLFAPVSKTCADQAILNGLAVGTTANQQRVTNPFVRNQTNLLTIAADAPPQDVIMLTDIRGDIYATCGALPRKSIAVPKPFLDAALANIQPMFRVNPVLSFGTTKDVKPLFPPPLVQGYDVSFVYGDPNNPPPDAPMPPTSPIANLPPTRVAINQGWLRLRRHT